MKERKALMRREGQLREILRSQTNKEGELQVFFQLNWFKKDLAEISWIKEKKGAIRKRSEWVVFGRIRWFADYLSYF